MMRIVAMLSIVSMMMAKSMTIMMTIMIVVNPERFIVAIVAVMGIMVAVVVPRTDAAQHTLRVV